MLKVSGSAALVGEAVAGYHSEGRYYLTKSKKDIEYYQKHADEMLKNAYPLMEIYRQEREKELNSFFVANTTKSGNRRSILSTLPLYTISEELLDAILSRHRLDDQQKQRIEKHAEIQKQRILAILELGTIEDEIPVFTSQEFKENPPTLELSGVFCETDFSYTEEEYAKHLQETESFAKQMENYTCKRSTAHAFRNLQILIHEGRWVMVSKGKAPAIHFVIRHPKLCVAIESFAPPITEHK